MNKSNQKFQLMILYIFRNSDAWIHFEVIDYRFSTKCQESRCFSYHMSCFILVIDLVSYYWPWFIIICVIENYSITIDCMGSMPKFRNQLRHTSIERSRRVGPESQTGWRKTHVLNFNEHKCPENSLLFALNLNWNWGAQSKRDTLAALQNPDFTALLCAFQGFHP